MIKTQLIGRIGKDATVYNFENGGSAINFSVAIDDTYKKKDGTKVENTIWVECSIMVSATGNTNRANYLKKGCIVFVEGKPEAQMYTKEGQACSKLKLLVSNCQNITWPEKETAQQGQVYDVTTTGATDVQLPF